jgi:hypothetical protein
MKLFLPFKHPKQMNDERLNFTSLLLVASSVIFISPFFLGMGGFKGNILSLMVLMIIFFIKRGRVSVKSSFSIFFLLFLSLFSMFYWESVTLIKFAIYFYSILFLIFLLSFEDIYKFTDYLSKFLIVLLIGGVIGFVYAYYLGGEAIFSIANEDTRKNGFYLSTFSSTYLNGLIRPSGIFDEPGALSFITCITVALRESLGMRRKSSWILLLLGFITLSTAHAIFFALYFAKIKFTTLKRFMINMFSLLIGLLLLMSFDNPINDVVSYVLNRFAIVDGGFVGDNRSQLLINAYSYLDLKTFLFGLDVNSLLNLSYADKGYAQFCCNPLTPLTHYGIFISLPYYLTIGYILVRSIKYKNLIAFGVFLLLLQRPYVMSYGYAVLIMIYAYSLSLKQKKALV